MSASVSAPIRLGSLEVRVEVSAGSAIDAPARAGAERMVDRAETAMQRARAAGLRFVLDETPVSPAAPAASTA